MNRNELPADLKDKELCNFIKLINGTFGFDDVTFVDTEEEECVSSNKIWVDNTAVRIMKKVFTNGNCGNFAIALLVFNNYKGELYEVIDEEYETPFHVIYKSIHNQYYDINGNVTDMYANKELHKIEITDVISNWVGNYCHDIGGPI